VPAACAIVASTLVMAIGLLLQRARSTEA